MVNIRKFLQGIGLVPKSSTTIDTQGEMEVLSSNGKLNYHNGTTASPVVTEAHTATLTNKSIDGGSNTLTNIPTSGFTGQVSVANGGTGVATIPAHAVVLGEGTSNIATAAPSTAGQALISNGASSDPSFQTLPISGGGSGQITQQAAIDALTGTQSSGTYLRSNGTHASLTAIQAGDVPTLNQNTTGTAANITASSNSTLTTLSSLALPASQLTGQVAIANGGTGQATQTAGFDALSPTTTKGDIIVNNGSNNVRQAIGTDTFVLTADSSQTTGVKWTAASGTASPLTTKGDLYGYSTTNARIPVGTNGQILSADSTQTTGVKWITSAVSPPRSEVIVDTGNGLGSTNTKIRRWSNIRKNIGSDITYADSSTLGGSFTINSDGIYSISYTDGNNSQAVGFAITVNGTQLTTDEASIGYAGGRRASTVSPAGFFDNCSWTGNLSTNDIVRAQAGGTTPDATTDRVFFSIVKVNS